MQILCAFCARDLSIHGVWYLWGVLELILYGYWRMTVITNLLYSFSRLIKLASVGGTEGEEWIRIQQFPLIHTGGQTADRTKPTYTLFFPIHRNSNNNNYRTIITCCTKVTWTQALWYQTADLITKVAVQWLLVGTQCRYAGQGDDSHPGRIAAG